MSEPTELYDDGDLYEWRECQACTDDEFDIHNPGENCIFCYGNRGDYFPVKKEKNGNDIL